VEEIESQLIENEEREASAQELIAATNYSKISDAKELLEKVWSDKEENFNLLDKQLIRKMTIWYLKALCHQTHGKPVADFIKMMEKEFKHVADFQSELDLEPERNLLEMARRYQL
jgi:hypothetical protein